MTRAEQIKEQLADIEAELGNVPRIRRLNLDSVSVDSILDNLEDAAATKEWPARRQELVERRRRLLREFELLPKSAKGEP